MVVVIEELVAALLGPKGIVADADIFGENGAGDLVAGEGEVGDSPRCRSFLSGCRCDRRA